MRGSPYYEEATQQVLKEIHMGKYVIVSELPEIISSMRVSPKPNGGVRLIHDCFCPEG